MEKSAMIKNPLKLNRQFQGILYLNNPKFPDFFQV